MYDVLRDQGDIREWVDYCLHPRTFHIKVDGRLVGETAIAAWSLTRLPAFSNPLHCIHVGDGMESGGGDVEEG